MKLEILPGSKPLEEIDDEYAYSIDRTFPDDGYSVAGRTASFGASDSGFSVLKFDNTGVDY